MQSVEQGQVNQHADRYDEDEIQGLDNQEEEPACCDDHRITTPACSKKKHKDGKFPRGDSREIKCYRVAVVSLGLLCVLLVIIIRLATKHITDTQRLESEIKQLKLNNDYLTQNEELLQARITNLTRENEKLTNSVCTFNTCFGSGQYYISRHMKNWADSQKHCTDLGARLVIIDSKEEQEFILEQGKKAWIGLSDTETEGVWKWVDGKVLDDSLFWMKGEPNDMRGSEDCVQIVPKTADIIRYLMEPAGGNLTRWNDEDCTKERYYICEKMTD